MKTLNRFLVTILIILIIVLAGLWIWGRKSTEPTPSPPARSTNAPARSTNAPARSTAAPAAAPTTPPQAVPAGAREQLQEALALKDQKKYVDARDALRNWLEQFSSSSLAPEAEAALSEISTQLILTPLPAPEKIDYTIQSGDSLDKIARKFNTTVELIQKSNRIQGSLIRPGDRLRIYRAKFSVVVDKATNTLTVYDNGKFFKKYRVGTGEYGLTPVGDFKIVDRIPNPPWWKDGKVIPFGDTNNVLGTHWLKLNVPGYGIHGTWEPDTIGSQSSAGCVRMLNEEVAELFMILPYGTPVTIQE